MEIFKNVYEFLSIANIDKTIDKTLLKDMLLEEMNEFFSAIDSNDRQEQLNAIIDMAWIVGNFAFRAGLTLPELTDEMKLVYESNMTKFCNTFTEALETKQAYEQGIHPNKPGEKISTVITTPQEFFSKFVVSRLDGKILKSLNFKDVNQLRNERNY